jgi:hypothetical protein
MEMQSLQYQPQNVDQKTLTQNDLERLIREYKNYRKPFVHRNSDNVRLQGREKVLLIFEPEQDIVDTAIKYSQNKRTCIHIFANDHNIGGAVARKNVDLTSKMPQEESIMLRTAGTILTTLEMNIGRLQSDGRYRYSIGSNGDIMGGERLGSNLYAIVVDNVGVYLNQNRQLLRNPYRPNDGLGSVVSAMIDMSGSKTGKENIDEIKKRGVQSYYEHLEKCWMTTIIACILAGYDVLVTGRWGTGVFANNEQNIVAALCNVLKKINNNSPRPFTVVYTGNRFTCKL